MRRRANCGIPQCESGRTVLALPGPDPILRATPARAPALHRERFVEQLIRHFVVLFVVIEPITLVPIFGALTRGADKRYRRVMALKAVALGTCLTLLASVYPTYVASRMRPVDAMRVEA